MVMSPGTYLRKRRLAAMVDLNSLARTMASMPWAVRPADEVDVARLAVRLRAAEQDEWTLSEKQMELVANVVPLDPRIYAQLVAIHYAGPGSVLAAPHVCRLCACSWHDPCHDHSTPGEASTCAWSDTDPHLCTACAAIPEPARNLAELFSGPVAMPMAGVAL